MSAPKRAARGKRKSLLRSPTAAELTPRRGRHPRRASTHQAPAPRRLLHRGRPSAAQGSITHTGRLPRADDGSPSGMCLARIQYAGRCGIRHARSSRIFISNKSIYFNVVSVLCRSSLYTFLRCSALFAWSRGWVAELRGASIRLRYADQNMGDRRFFSTRF